MTPTLSQRLADSLSLRTAVLLLGGWLILAPPGEGSPLHWLDRSLYRAAVALTPARVQYEAPVEAGMGVWQTTLGGVTNRWAEPPQADRGYHTPDWFYPGFALLVGLIGAYLLGLVPRLSASAALLSTALLSLVLLAGQLGAQISRGYWLPTGLALQYLWLGGGLMAAHWTQRRWHRRALALGRQLAAERFRSDDWRRALDGIDRELADARALAQIYQWGREFERHGQSEPARACYEKLNRLAPGYRDLPARMRALSRESHRGESAELSQTQALPEFVVPQQLGRYRIERELGRGAMGVVYLGRDPQIGRHVAIKTLDTAPFEAGEREALKKRFFREAEAAGRLRHPNIVTIHDAGEEGELAFIAMDWVRGQPLSDHTREGQLLPVAQVYRLVEQVAGALHYAHGESVVHRDIKPGNILYEPDNDRVVVTDFGIARVTDSARTQTGEVLGSPLYMSPEQLKGERVGPASDQFSLGVTFYQLLSGAAPFRGETLAELSYRVVQSRHRPLPQVRADLPRSAARIVNRALQKTPEKRYANAGEMAKALNSALRKDF